jgi:hypothetical protein
MTGDDLIHLAEVLDSAMHQFGNERIPAGVLLAE